MGLEGGKPQAGATGAAPEWFYKGDGSIVRSAGQALTMPSFAFDGGDEAEIVGLYVNGPDGTPHRVGYALGNEFSDHVLEQQNYLYLAHSKLRECAIGPALLVGELPEHVTGVAPIRDSVGNIRWEKDFLSGGSNMCHSIRNLEHHHFKYALFRRPGDAHLHFFGAAVLSFADQIQVLPDESFEGEAHLFGPPLLNTLKLAEGTGHPGQDAVSGALKPGHFRNCKTPTAPAARRCGACRRPAAASYPSPTPPIQ